jgi:hypothetical protein
MERAAVLFAAADALRRVIGHPRCPPSEGASDERLLALARTALGEERFAAAWQQGQAWTMEEAAAYLLGEEGSTTTELAPEAHQ